MKKVSPEIVWQTNMKLTVTELYVYTLKQWRNVVSFTKNYDFWGDSEWIGGVWYGSYILECNSLKVPCSGF